MIFRMVFIPTLVIVIIDPKAKKKKKKNPTIRFKNKKFCLLEK